MILEYEFVDNFQINVTIENNLEYLTISGHSLHSALNIKKIELVTGTSDVIILVHLTLFRSGKSPGGAFSYKYEIDNSVQRVLFGKEKTLIWERGE